MELNNATAAGALKVRPMWLTVSSTERYLLLEDTATGDVLLPLIYMKVSMHSNPSALTLHSLSTHLSDSSQNASHMTITDCHIHVNSESCCGLLVCQAWVKL